MQKSNRRPGGGDATIPLIMTGTPIDYRSPATGGHRVQRIVNELIAAEAISSGAIYGRAAIGAVLSLVGPILVAIVIKTVEAKWSESYFPGFWNCVALAAVVLVPLLLWLERRTRGEFFSDAVRGESPLGNSSSRGEYELQGAQFLWTAYTEIALTGPRLLWEAYDAMRGGAPIDAATRVVAARIVVALHDADGGIAVSELLRPEWTPPATITAAVNYLASAEIVGISRRRDRVWLSTAWRVRLYN